MNLKEYMNFKSKKLYTPLHIAAMYGSVSIAECLISDFRVTKESCDYKERTPLYVAAEYS